MEEVLKRLEAIDKNLAKHYSEFLTFREETGKNFKHTEDIVEFLAINSEKHERDIEWLKANTVTHADLRNELKNFATKDDLKNLATKDELRQITTTLDELLGLYKEDRQERVLMNHAIRRLETKVFPER